jgi:hypothetical protein
VICIRILFSGIITRTFFSADNLKNRVNPPGS